MKRNLAKLVSAAILYGATCGCSDNLTAPMPPMESLKQDSHVAPANLSASDGLDTRVIRVSWTSEYDEAPVYEISRAEEGSENFTVVHRTMLRSWMDSKQLLPGVRYQYRVRAIFADAETPFSNTDIGFLKDDSTQQMAAPTNLQASDGLDTRVIRISWTAEYDETPVYEISRAEEGSENFTVVHSTMLRSWMDTKDLVPGVRYQYRVRAICPDAESPFSNTDTGFLKVG